MEQRSWWIVKLSQGSYAIYDREPFLWHGQWYSSSEYKVEGGSLVASPEAREIITIRDRERIISGVGQIEEGKPVRVDLR